MPFLFVIVRTLLLYDREKLSDILRLDVFQESSKSYAHASRDLRISGLIRSNCANERKEKGECIVMSSGVLQ